MNTPMMMMPMTPQSRLVFRLSTGPHIYTHTHTHVLSPPLEKKTQE